MPKGDVFWLLDWRKKVQDYPIKSCGRLDMSTYLPEEVTLGRVASDRVRYVYFEDGTECIVLGKYCDQVAFRAADWTPPAPKERLDGSSPWERGED